VQNLIENFNQILCVVSSAVFHLLNEGSQIRCKIVLGFLIGCLQSRMHQFLDSCLVRHVVAADLATDLIKDHRFLYNHALNLQLLQLPEENFLLLFILFLYLLHLVFQVRVMPFFATL